MSHSGDDGLTQHLMEPDDPNIDPNMLAVATLTTDRILRRVANEQEMHSLRDIIDTEIAVLLHRIKEQLKRRIDEHERRKAT
jgi:hypothetical protein